MDCYDGSRQGGMRWGAASDGAGMSDAAAPFCYPIQKTLQECLGSMNALPGLEGPVLAPDRLTTAVVRWRTRQSAVCFSTPPGGGRISRGRETKAEGIDRI